MSDRTDETTRIRELYDDEAPRYDRTIAFFEKALFADGRRWVCSRACGEVLELAVGTGRNLPHYTADVRLTGIELSPAMLDIARRRARDTGREVDLQLGDAEALQFPDESFDTVTCTLALCTIPDDRAAVAEAGRVLRPGRAPAAARARPQPATEDPCRPEAAGPSRRPVRRRPPRT